MSYPINEDEFVEICMKELEEYDETDIKAAHANHEGRQALRPGRG